MEDKEAEKIGQSFNLSTRRFSSLLLINHNFLSCSAPITLQLSCNRQAKTESPAWVESSQLETTFLSSETNYDKENIK